MLSQTQLSTVQEIIKGAAEHVVCFNDREVVVLKH
jgi:hypothetical protein